MNRRSPWIRNGIPLALLAVSLLVLSCGGSEEATPILGEEEEAGSILEGVADSVLPSPEEAGVLVPPEPDKIIAKVNGTPIRQRDVYRLAQTSKFRMQGQGKQLQEGSDKELLGLSLQALINAELMIQQAREHGLEVPPEQLEAELEAVRSRFEVEEDYWKYLDKAGITQEDVRREAERRLQMTAYQKFLAKSQTVKESEAEKFYRDNPQMFMEGESVRAAQILVRTAREDTPAEREKAQGLIQEVFRKASAGEDFATLAREYSQAPNAAKGGDLGYFPRGKMVPKFEEMAFNTPVGEISSVFETPFGYNVIKVLDKREPALKPFEEVKPLLMVQLTRLKESEALQAKLIQLREESEIEILDEELTAEEPDAVESVKG